MSLPFKMTFFGDKLLRVTFSVWKTHLDLFLSLTNLQAEVWTTKSSFSELNVFLEPIIVYKELRLCRLS